MSGNKNVNTSRVCIATDDIPIALVNTKLDHLSDNLDTLASKLDVLETSLTRIEPKEASSTYLAGGNVGHGNAVSGTIVDTDGYRYMTVFAKASNSNQIVIQYSNNIFSNYF